MGEYSKTLSYYEQAARNLPKNFSGQSSAVWLLLTTTSGWCTTRWASTPKPFPIMNKHWKSAKKLFRPIILIWLDLTATSASVYDKMDEYSKAFSYHEQALEIRQKTLPVNHTDFAQSYNSIGSVYNNMGEYSKALSYS